jgi:hypothetical protein
MATTEADRRDGKPPAGPATPPSTTTSPPSTSTSPPPSPPVAGPEAPRRRRDKELAAVERALQVLDGDTQAIAATSACLAALAGVDAAERRAAIVALLTLDPAGMRLAKVVLEDRWTRDAGQAG